MLTILLLAFLHHQGKPKPPVLPPCHCVVIPVCDENGECSFLITCGCEAVPPLGN